MKKLFIALVMVIILSSATVFFGNTVCILFESDRPSQSIGTASNGKLIHGKRLPSRGENFTCYSYIGTLLGRNSVHGKVRAVVLETYAALAKEFPEKTFVYGETGWPSGGDFYPHKTHENGLCVDFMVPVLNEGDKSVPLPTSVFNKGGYSIQFDARGRFQEYRIDYEAMAAHIRILVQTAKENGLRVRRVIFDPKLQSALLRTKAGKQLKRRVVFSSRRSWVRHDEHYHVDFSL